MGLGVRGKGLGFWGWGVGGCLAGKGFRGRGSAEFLFFMPLHDNSHLLISSLIFSPSLSLFLSWAYPLCGECQFYPGRGAGGSVAGRGLPVWLMG